MGAGDLEKRLEQLAERLERIERHLKLAPHDEQWKARRGNVTGSRVADDTGEAKSQTTQRGDSAPTSPTDHQPKTPTTRPAPPREAQLASATPPATPPTAPPTAPSTTSPIGRKGPALESSQAVPKVDPVSPIQPTSTYRSTGDAGDSTDNRSIELAIGGKWAAWVGAIIVVLGVSFAAREYGTGIWASLPNIVQALIIAAFGGMLVLAGELALRKVGPLASVGLFGAGLGVLYLVAYSTFAFFDPPILSSGGAFLLMALIALGGFAITLRTMFLTIGVLSLIGGYLTPILLAEGGGEPIAAFGYLTMLPAIALSLAAAMPGSFRPLRGVALGGQTIIGLVIILTFASSNWLMALIFISIWWMLFIGESTYAALHDRSPNNNAITTLLATAAYVTCATWVLANFPAAGSAWIGAFVLSVAVISAAIAAQITTGLDVLKSISPRAVDRLGIALFAQTGVLLVVAAALQFDDYGASVSWLAIALAAIEIGRRVGSKGTSIFGLFVGALACVKIATIDQFLTALDATLWSWHDLHISGWALLGLFAIAAVHIAARRIGEHRGEFWNAMPILLTIIAMTGWVMWCMNNTDGLLLTGGWLLGSAALFATSAIGMRQRYLEIGLVLLLITAGKWLVIDAFGQRFAPGWDATAMAPLLNAQMALALAIGIVASLAFHLLRQRDQQSIVPRENQPTTAGWWSVVLLAGSVFLLIAMSFEIDRYVLGLAASADALQWAPGHLRQLMLTMLWSIGALGIGLVGMLLIRRGSPDHLAVRVLLGCAWFIAAGMLTKWVLIDTLYWHVTTAREAALGVMLFGNAQLVAGLVLAASAVGLLFVTMRVRAMTQLDDDRNDVAAPAWSMLTHVVPPAAALLVLWGLSFEVDRLLGNVALREGFTPIWPHAQWVALWLTGLWAAGGMTMMLIGRWRAIVSMVLSGWCVIALAAVIWLVVDTLLWRLTEGAIRAMSVINLQFAIGLAAAALLACGIVLLRRWNREQAPTSGLAPSRTPLGNFIAAQTTLALTLITLVGFWLGSFEIDRAFIDNAMARQVGWSVFWAGYGVMLVLIGFVRLAPAARYAGLALLCATVAKVMVIDLGQVDQIWRVVSFLVLGLLLLATSVAYMKFAPRLLRTLQSQPAK